MKKNLIILLLGLISIFSGLSLFAMGESGDSSADGKGSITLRLAHIYSPDDAWHKGAMFAADKVAKATNGRIKIEVYPSSQLGTEVEILEQTLTGSIDIAESGSGQIGTIFKPMNAFEMPYLFKDNQQVLSFSRSDIAQKIWEDFRKKFGGKIIGASSWGVRQLTSNKPINSPADLKGFKLRVPQQTITLAYGKAMGANPTPIAYVEAYLALQQGVVDGLENPLSSIKVMKFYEVQKYINMTKHVTNLVFFVMNDDKYKKLDPKDQEILLSAFSDASDYIVKLIDEEDANLVSFFKSKGLKINYPDLDAFRKATASMPKEYASWWSDYGDLYSIIQNWK